MTGLAQYRTVNAVSTVQDASPHRLIQIMFEGLLTRLATARGQIVHKDYQGKGRSIHSALAIIDALQQCLDLERGGDLARNLDALYDYATRRLFSANVDNSVAMIDEVVDLIVRVKSGWDAIAPVAQGGQGAQGARKP